MSRNAYMQIAGLSMHPAFTMKAAALQCPICSDFTTLRVAEYNAHFLAHKPTEEQGYRYLSGRYERQAPKLGWATSDEAWERYEEVR